VHDALLVRLLERRAQLARDLERFVDRQRPALQPLGEVLSWHELHDEHVRVSAVRERRDLEAVEVRDARMVE
jgi:hypothetical protein